MKVVPLIASLPLVLFALVPAARAAEPAASAGTAPGMAAPGETPAAATSAAAAPSDAGTTASTGSTDAASASASASAGPAAGASASSSAISPGLPSHDPNGDPVATAEEKDRVELKFGHGITFRSASDDFHFQMRGRIQPRFDSTFADGAETINGFSIRRARLAFNGRFFKDWELYVQLGFSPRDNEPDQYNPLRDATITYAGLRDAMIRVGQMKVPFDRQRMTSSSALQFADRSLVVTELTLDRDVGAQLLSEDLGGLDGRFGYNLGLFAGDGRNRSATNSGLMLVARLWTSPFGKFDPQSEGDLKRESNFRLALGVAAARNFQSVRARSTSSTTYDFATFDYSHLTADLTMKWRGFSSVSQIIYRGADQPSVTQGTGAAAVTEYSRSGWGFFTQAGYMWTDHLETAARYGEFFPLQPTDPALVRLREVGGAVSWYFSGHNLKMTADYFWLPQPSSDTETHQIRLQGQLYF
ncbi:MAG TPA: porin [Polyangiaceae bacterium]|nr:porin [Polyangiaceae bacterium]